MNYFSSDPHLDHERVIAYCKRPFKSSDEMDRTIIDRQKATVGPDDDYFLLGDTTLVDAKKSPARAEYVARLIGEMNGRIHIIPGNHDRSSTLALFRGLKNVEVMSRYEELNLPDGTKVVMCHYPMLVWNKSHRGSYMLHGHSHGGLKYPFPARIMDVGVDPNNFFPVSLDQVKEKLDKFPAGSHHG